MERRPTREQNMPIEPRGPDVVPLQIWQAAEKLYDWQLPNGHPDRGKYGINPWRLLDSDAAYRERDKAIMLLASYILREPCHDLT